MPGTGSFSSGWRPTVGPRPKIEEIVAIWVREQRGVGCGERALIELGADWGEQRQLERQLGRGCWCWGRRSGRGRCGRWRRGRRRGSGRSWGRLLDTGEIYGRGHMTARDGASRVRTAHVLPVRKSYSVNHIRVSGLGAGEYLILCERVATGHSGLRRRIRHFGGSNVSAREE